ncbi:MAG: signal peptidase I, partial [Actinomycetota bacterium]|nr:signal peptidase I [Actinomycetota bacterium]
ARTRSVVRVLAVLVPALLLAVLVETFVVSPVSVSGGSMGPELRDGERVLVSHLSYVLREPRRGDVVAFRSPLEDPDRSAFPVRIARGTLEALGLRDAPSGTVLERVVAVGGETVEARDGRLVVNDRALDEPYLRAPRVTDDFDAERVPDGHVWVMGDDRGATPFDSRSFGTVDIDALRGRAVLRTWPPLRLGTP